MQKIPVRVAWALAATAALSVTGAVPMAPSTPASPGSPVSAWRGQTATPSAAMVPLSPSHACLVEMQIEIAWLADPMTFPYPMAARLAGGTLEIGGLVPSEAVRQRALYLAREYSGMSVVDHLHVQAGLPEPGGRGPDGVLARKAAEAVSATLAKHGRTFEANADAAGCVTISGSVPSCEEKLAVSRRLSRLHGCCCVVNKLEVMKTGRDGKQWINVSADGIQQVPDELVRRPVIQQQPQPPIITEHWRATPAGPEPAPLPPVQQRAWVVTDFPSAPPAAPKPAVLPPAPQDTPAVSAYRATSTAAPMSASLPPAPQRTPPASAYWATSTTAPISASLPPAQQGAPADSAYRPIPAPAPKSASLSAASATPNTAQSWKAVAAQPVAKATPLAPSGAAGLSTAPVAKPSNFKEAESTAARSNVLAPPRTFAAPAQVLGINSPTASEKAVAATMSRQPVTQPSPEPSSFIWPNAPTKSAATPVAPVYPNGVQVAQTTWRRGVAPASYQTPIAAPKPAAPTAAAQSRPAGTPPAPPEALLQLRRRIDTACGNTGRVVDIKVKSPPTDLEIQVKVRNQEAARHLGRTILSMPELQPYHVDLAVTWQ